MDLHAASFADISLLWKSSTDNRKTKLDIARNELIAGHYMQGSAMVQSNVTSAVFLPPLCQQTLKIAPHNLLHHLQTPCNTYTLTISAFLVLNPGVPMPQPTNTQISTPTASLHDQTVAAATSSLTQCTQLPQNYSAAHSSPIPFLRLLHAVFCCNSL